jgi:hypothetical protein
VACYWLSGYTYNQGTSRDLYTRLLAWKLQQSRDNLYIFSFSNSQLFKHLFEGEKMNFSGFERARGKQKKKAKKWKSILLCFTCVGFNHTDERAHKKEQSKAREKKKNRIQSVNKSNCLLKIVK